MGLNHIQCKNGLCKGVTGKNKYSWLLLMISFFFLGFLLCVFLLVFLLLLGVGFVGVFFFGGGGVWLLFSCFCILCLNYPQLYGGNLTSSELCNILRYLLSK